MPRRIPRQADQVNAVDAALLELRQRRAALDEAIAVLERVDGGPRTPTAAAPPAVPPRKAKELVGSPRGSRKTDVGQAERVRALYEQGVEVGEIERQTKVKKATIYYRANAGNWKRPKNGSPAKGDALPGKVRCPHCEIWTDVDPCSGCGKKVRK